MCNLLSFVASDRWKLVYSSDATAQFIKIGEVYVVTPRTRNGCILFEAQDDREAMERVFIEML